jgi:hypothetical protein
MSKKILITITERLGTDGKSRFQAYWERPSGTVWGTPQAHTRADAMFDLFDQIRKHAQDRDLISIDQLLIEGPGSFAPVMANDPVQKQFEKDMTALDQELTEAERAAGIDCSAAAPRDYRATAAALWTLLDEIDTLGDSLKPSDLEGYRKCYVKTGVLCAGRHALLKSDGHTLRLPDEPPSPAPEQVKFKDELERALRQPTLVDALSLAATFENERAVAQALRGKHDPHTGALWDTMFKHVFTQVLDGWQKEHDLFPDTNELGRIRGWLLKRFKEEDHVRPTWQLLSMLIDRMEERTVKLEGQLGPVPMLLYCPMCHTKHIDEGEFATKVHHTHACQGRSGDGRRCGHVWRPAIVPTVGVEALPGFINE